MHYLQLRFSVEFVIDKHNHVVFFQSCNYCGAYLDIVPCQKTICRYSLGQKLKSYKIYGFNSSLNIFLWLLQLSESADG